METLLNAVNPKEILRNIPFTRKFEKEIEIHIEKELPYLIICRKARKKERKLIKNEASFIWATQENSIDELVRDLTKQIADDFGACILIEFWINDYNYDTFRITYPEGRAPATANALEEGLKHYKNHFPHLKILREPTDKRCPEDLNEFLDKYECKKAGILKIGLEIPSFFIDPKSKKPLPVFFRKFRHQFSNILKKGIYEFIRVQTKISLNDYRLLGRKILNDAVWEVDQALTDIERQFEFLLLIAPSNSDESWKEFEEAGYNKNPTFHYRLLPIDPDELKNKLYSIDIDKVDDPSIAFIFREKREELDTLITMLNERNSKDFLYSSMRLFKDIDHDLLETARTILSVCKNGHHKEDDYVNEDDFREEALKELRFYRSQNQMFNPTVETRDDMVGIMVSKGQLYIGKNFLTSSRRVYPLLQHEVGTHMVTYFNGSQQPLQMMRTGLAGYDELQEGIAVLSEYLVGGLTTNRLRILAARVTATQDMIDGGEFKDIYHQLTEEHGLSKSTAYELVTRIFQSGGYTKDIIYLRGLMKLMEYLENGGNTDILFLGKIADKHVNVVGELLDRRILTPAILQPRFMQDNTCLERLEQIKRGMSLTKLIDN